MGKAEAAGGFLTVPAAADILGKPKMTLYRWIAKGKLITVEFGGIKFVSAGELARLQELLKKDKAAV